MFKERTDELLDLAASVQGCRKAFLAQTRRPASLCSCSCCTVVAR